MLKTFENCLLIASCGILVALLVTGWRVVHTTVPDPPEINQHMGLIRPQWQPCKLEHGSFLFTMSHPCTGLFINANDPRTHQLYKEGPWTWVLGWTSINAMEWSSDFDFIEFEYPRWVFDMRHLKKEKNETLSRCSGSSRSGLCLDGPRYTHPDSTRW